MEPLVSLIENFEREEYIYARARVCVSVSTYIPILTRSPSRAPRCWNDCYSDSATPLDNDSLSRESRLVSLDCESYSLDIESQVAGDRTRSAQSMSRTSSETEELAAPTITRAGATEGATAGGMAPETVAWVDRPTATGQAQVGGGAPTIGAARYNALLLVTVVLALLSISHSP